MPAMLQNNEGMGVSRRVFVISAPPSIHPISPLWRVPFFIGGATLPAAVRPLFPKE